MADPSNHLKEFLVTLSRNDVKFIVCGGVAAILHGVPRITLDLDISVDMDPENLERLFSSMDDLGLKPKMPVDLKILLEPDAITTIVEEKGAMVFTFIDPEQPIRHIDMFLTKELAHDVLKEHVEIHEIDGCRVSVLSARYLLKLKLAIEPRRHKDVLDIQTLSEQLDEG